jgi:hypothetical protein
MNMPFLALFPLKASCHVHRLAYNSRSRISSVVVLSLRHGQCDLASCAVLLFMSTNELLRELMPAAELFDQLKSAAVSAPALPSHCISA